jgi:uncharacterized membrane protein
MGIILGVLLAIGIYQCIYIWAVIVPDSIKAERDAARRLRERGK